MKLWYATFGGGHTHPLTHEPLRDCYVMVPGDTYGAAHNTMMQSVFGRKWAFLYEFADEVPEHRAGTAKAANVTEFGLREIPFVPPSPVAEVLWEAYHTGQFTMTGERWIDRVLRPAEVAHWRSMMVLMEVRPGDVAKQPATVDGISRTAEVEPAKDVLPTMPLPTMDALIEELGGSDPARIDELIDQRDAWETYARALDAERQLARPVLDAVGRLNASLHLGADPDFGRLLEHWKAWAATQPQRAEVWA